MKLITIVNVLGILFLVIVSKTQGSSPIDPSLICKGQAADIVFVLDSSRSIWGEDFKKQLDFVIYMVDHLDIGIGPQQVRIGVVTFSDEATIHIDLNNFLDKANLKWKIKDITQILGNTSIGNGLAKMRDEMFTPNKGARPAVRHIAIVITDGYSQDEQLTHREARTSRHANIEIFVIGIGKFIRKSELKAIATKPHTKYLYYTATYDTLENIRADVITETCTGTTWAPPPTTETVPGPICKGKPADIIFVLDSSTSIWREEFQIQLDFVKYMIDQVDIGIGPKEVRIGVVTFSDEAAVHINLNDFLDKSILKWRIDQIPQILGNTSIGNGLKETRTVMFTPQKGARFNVRHIAIVITDGTSQDKPASQREAQACRAAGIELYVIGIGHYITESELKGIASKPLEKYYFFSPNYKALDNIRDDVVKNTCTDVVNPTWPATTQTPVRTPEPMLNDECKDGGLIEVVFMISHTHIGPEKTRQILSAIIRVIETFEFQYTNVYFGAVFEDCEPNQDVIAGSIIRVSHLKQKLEAFRFGSFVSLLKKLTDRSFSSNGRRIGFMFLDNTIDLNTRDVYAEMHRLSLEPFELYAALIGNVNEKLVEDQILPRNKFTKVHSYNHLEYDLPSKFTNLICKQ